MIEVPRNYDAVMNDISHAKRFSSVRLDSIRQNLLDVLNGGGHGRFADWNKFVAEVALKSVNSLEK